MQQNKILFSSHIKKKRNWSYALFPLLMSCFSECSINFCFCAILIIEGNTIMAWWIELLYNII